MNFQWREGLLGEALPFFLCLLAGTAIWGCRPDPAGAGAPVVFEGSDGLALHGTIYTPSDPNPPGLVLMHMLGSSRSAWEPFATQAVRRGYMVLSFDLRGHGESTGKREHPVTHRSMDADDWRRAVADVGYAKEALVAAGADADDLGLVGASIGANLALSYAQGDPQIQAIVLLSPGEAYKGLKILPVMKDYRRRPVLILAAEGDSHSAATARKLKRAARDYCEVRIYPGTAHGTDLLAAARNAPGQIFLWLEPILRSGEEGK